MKELKEVVTLGIHLANALGESLEDGKLDWTDIPNFWPVATSLTDALDKIELALKEFDNINDFALRELCEDIKEKFDIPQDGLEAIIESSLEILSALFRTYMLSRKV